MADFADDAQLIQEQHLALTLASRKRTTLPAMGSCHYCEHTVSGEQLFCDHECADGWEALQRANARNGRQAVSSAALAYA